MAHLFEIDTPRSASERAAQQELSKILPRPWIITTNIKEPHFLGLRARAEIDSVLICPEGVFVLDFKNFKGKITPMISGGWKGVDDAKNPFGQLSDIIYVLKDLLISRDQSLSELWIEWAVVLTNSNVTLNWMGSDVTPALKIRVAFPSGLENSLRSIADRRTKVTRDQARKVLKALRADADTDVYLAEWGGNQIEPSQAIPRAPSQPVVIASSDGGQQRNVPLESTRTSSPYDASEWGRVIDGMFRFSDWGTMRLFELYLTLYGRQELAVRSLKQPISSEELSFLRDAKRDFDNRMQLSHQLRQSMSAQDISWLMQARGETSGLVGLVDDHRLLQIVKTYCEILYAKADGKLLDTLSRSYRRFHQLRWQYDRIICELRSMSTYGVVPPEAIDLLPDRDTAADLIAANIKARHAPLQRLVDRLSAPWLPWSSESQAYRLVGRAEVILAHPIVQEFQEHFQSIADVFARTIGLDEALKHGLMKEAVTGIEYEVSNKSVHTGRYHSGWKGPWG